MALNLGTKVFIILFCISFMTYIAPNDAAPYGYGYGTGANFLTNGTWANLVKVFNVGGLAQGWLIAVIGIAGLVILATSTVFPNAFTLFAGISGAFAVFIMVPWNILKDTNNLGFGCSQLIDTGCTNTSVLSIIPPFFIVIFGFLVFIVVFSMFKGTDF